MNEDAKLAIRFWGVRGSCPTPVAQNAGIGGNTACLELAVPSGDVIIFDSGTGVRALGETLLGDAAGNPLKVNIFLTHFHWDHIQGIPFFLPLNSERNEVTFHAMGTPTAIERALAGQMDSPYFPVTLGQRPAAKRFMDVRNREFRFGNTRITSFPLHHPQGCYGYRVETDASSVAYASDFEHGDREGDRALLNAIEGVDLLIYDAQFTPEEYSEHQGWGHSTWLEATRFAKQAGIGRLCLFHHDPGHSDEVMVQVLADAQREFAATFLAKESDRITP